MHFLLQESGWSQYPTFDELHQILYRAELNVYEAFNMPGGVTTGEGGSHVNEKTMEMVKKLLDRPPKFIVEVSRLVGHLESLGCLIPALCIFSYRCPARHSEGL